MTAETSEEPGYTQPTPTPPGAEETFPLRPVSSTSCFFLRKIQYYGEAPL